MGSLAKQPAVLLALICGNGHQQFPYYVNMLRMVPSPPANLEAAREGRGGTRGHSQSFLP